MPFRKKLVEFFVINVKKKVTVLHHTDESIGILISDHIFFFLCHKDSGFDMKESA